MTVFLSYRRVDSAASTGRLYDALAVEFARSGVFMDVDGHIQPAVEWARVIDENLAACRLLVVVVGPQWISCTRDGKRRLDHDDDWVRREILTAFGRKIPIVPVLVDGAPKPDVKDLPGGLAQLDTLQWGRLEHDDWVKSSQSIIAIIRGALGEAPSPIEAAARALSMLSDQIRRSPAVAQIVGRYRTVISANSRRLRELDIYKRIHDSLHAVEERVLRVLRRPNVSAAQLAAARASFMRLRRDIAASVAAYSGLQQSLLDELQVGLDGSQSALDRAMATPTQQTLEGALAELAALIGTLPTQLDLRIAAAVEYLRTEGQLEHLVTDLRASTALEENGIVTDLGPLFVGLEGLETIRADFTRLVDEHSRLQRIDVMVRSVCASPTSLQWSQVKTWWARLPKPPSDVVADMSDALDKIAAEVDTAFAANTTNEIRERLESFQETFSAMFHDVDVHLKNVSSRVGVIDGPLQQLLA